MRIQFRFLSRRMAAIWPLLRPRVGYQVRRNSWRHNILLLITRSFCHPWLAKLAAAQRTVHVGLNRNIDSANGIVRRRRIGQPCAADLLNRYSPSRPLQGDRPGNLFGSCRTESQYRRRPLPPGHENGRRTFTSTRLFLLRQLTLGACLDFEQRQVSFCRALAVAKVRKFDDQA